VPYIGTWWAAPPPKESGTFRTGYKNFIYLPEDDLKIRGRNPLDNPEYFGIPLIGMNPFGSATPT
jgi:hypothetical protein